MADGRSRAAELYREYGPAVYRRCLRLLRDPEAARDAAQDVFMKLVRDMEKLEDRPNVVPWIYRVATNHCLNLRRNAARRGEEGGEEALELAEGPTEADTFPARALARELLARFDASTQAVAVGVLVDGMEHGELAEALGISRRTVARRLERFLERSRRFLQEDDR